MPELPEVETVLRSLVGKVEDRSICDVEVMHPKVIEPLTPEQFVAGAKGQTIRGVRRRGKYLLLDLSDDNLLLIHLRMTGRLALVAPEIPRARHTHVVLHLDDGLELRFIDPRRFGHVMLLTREQLEQIAGYHGLGPEPLGDQFTLCYLRNCVKSRKVSIKGLMLNQGLIAGLGNIYTDEALHLAAVHPERAANSLSDEELSRLHQAIRQVLQEGIDHRGSSFRDYVDAQGVKGNYQDLWRVYGRAGLPCPRCGTVLIKSRVAGRGTHWCPSCQPCPQSLVTNRHTEEM